MQTGPLMASQLKSMMRLHLSVDACTFLPGLIPSHSSCWCSD